MGKLQLYGITNLALGIGRASSLTPDDEDIVRARAIARTLSCRRACSAF